VQLSGGDSATVQFDAYPGLWFRGSVTEIAGSPDPRSGLYEVELTVDPDGKRLMSGFVSRIEIMPSKRDTYYIVPVEAVVEADGAAGYLFAFDPGTSSVRKIPVAIELFLGSDIAVSGDLEGIGAIVTTGAPYLGDGMVVRVAEEH
jgi:multidrug efflux pump subunit AcrA (membrane-fusion protein)